MSADEFRAFEARAHLIEHTRAHARAYRNDAATLANDPQAAAQVDGVRGLSAEGWRLIYEQTARELDKFADELEEQ